MEIANAEDPSIHSDEQPCQLFRGSFANKAVPTAVLMPNLFLSHPLGSFTIPSIIQVAIGTHFAHAWVENFGDASEQPDADQGAG